MATMTIFQAIPHKSKVDKNLFLNLKNNELKL
jgi:hypothetical protein